jgi:large subunit ribosomal protein L4
MSSLTVDVLDIEGNKSGSIDLPADVFDAQANISLLHQVVVAQLAAKRQGTSKAKGRGEVRGGGAKPYRQKGTGRARQGSTRAPQFAGGGVVHGPQPRSYAQKTPKKMKAAALRGALSDRARAGLVFVVAELAAGDNAKTKTALNILRSAVPFVDQPKKRVLVVLDRDDLAGWVSLRNVPSVHLLVADQLNTYDVLVSDAVVFTETALHEFLSGRSAGGVEVEVVIDDEAEAVARAAEDADTAGSTAADVAESAESVDSVETAESVDIVDSAESTDIPEVTTDDDAEESK